MALTTSAPQVNARRATYRQRRMGPAPFASLEDLSDEQDSPPPGGSGGGAKLPGIREDPQPSSSSLHTPSTPRIDISRASSSSHHDSNNSSPERELFAGEVPCKLGLGFKEDAADLRSSTEELDLGDDEVGCEERPRSRRGSARSARQELTRQELTRQELTAGGGRPRGGSLSKYELDAAAAARDRERHDSLSIVSAGRTSRLSSVGSAASAASSAASASHLSVASSGGGRSPSPHKMLLETSFCGSKPLLTQPSIELDELPPTSKEAIAQVEGGLLGAPAGDGSRSSSRRSSGGGGGGEGDGGRRRRRRAEDGPPLLLPHVSPVVSPAERELLAAKERALAEEVVRELEHRRAEKPASLSLPVSPPPSSGAAPALAVAASRTPSASPKPSRRPQLRDADSRTPSPGSVSRKSSFASLFRRAGGSSGGGDTTPSAVVSPESPTGSTGVRRNKSGSFSTILGDGFRERSRSRSKSRERSQPEGKPRAKAVFSALFKKKERRKAEPASPGDLPSPEARVPQQAAEPLATVEFKFDAEAEAPAASQPPAVVHRPERGGSGGGGGGGGGGMGAEEAAAHRRAASSKRRAMHEAQLLPQESQGLADVIAGSALDRSSSAESGEQPPPPPPHKKSQQQQQQSGEWPSGEDGRPPHNKCQQQQQAAVSREDAASARPPRQQQQAGERLSSEDAASARPPRQQQQAGERLSSEDAASARPPRQQQQAGERLSSEDAASARPPAEPPRQQRSPYRSEREQQQHLSELRKLKPRRPDRQQDGPPPEAPEPAGSAEPPEPAGAAERRGAPQERPAVAEPRPEELPEAAAARLRSLEVEGATTTTVAHQALSEEASPAGSAILPAQGAAPASTEEERASSDSEAEFARVAAAVLGAEPAGAEPGAGPAGAEPAEAEAERQGLVLQDSFEGELPYVPTTLPQERSVAVPIVPVRQRCAAEVRTCPIERPRSTTPINPALLEEFAQHEAPPPPPADRMRIQLPRPLAAAPAAPGSHDAAPGSDAGQLPRARSPRSRTPSGRSWLEFAEQGAGLQSPREGRKPSLSASSPSPPPLPPRAHPPPPPPPPQPAAPAARQWINFEEIPEKRKPPRRIQTLPASTAGPPVVYSYVDPEECECECHETSGGKSRAHSSASTTRKKKDKDKEKERDKERDKEKTKSDERPRSRSRSRSHSRSRDMAGGGDGKAAALNREQRQPASPTAEGHAHPHPHPHHQHPHHQHQQSSGGDRLDVTDVADRNSYLSDSSYEFPNSYSIDTSDYSDGLKPMKPFGMDLDVTSNRSSIISQQDETQSPEGGSPNGNETKHRQ